MDGERRGELRGALPPVGRGGYRRGFLCSPLYNTLNLRKQGERVILNTRRTDEGNVG